MTKKTPILILLIFISLASVYGAYCFIQKVNAPTDSWAAPPSEYIDPLNATYYIDNQQIKLVNGRYEENIVHGSATKNQYYVWKSPSYGDLNGDNFVDATMIIINNNGGSGTFYYLVVALGKNDSTVAGGINGLLLGDRITIRNVLIKNKEITVNYLDRKIDEPMTVSPSIEMSLKFIVKDNTLLQIPDITTDSQNCVKYGGEVKSSLCCQSAGDFSNSCLVGACGCSPVNSHQVQTCDCGEGKCFDGTQCIKVK